MSRDLLNSCPLAVRTHSPLQDVLFRSCYPATIAPMPARAVRGSRLRKCCPYIVLLKYAMSSGERVRALLPPVPLAVPLCVLNVSCNGPTLRLSSCPVTVVVPPPLPPPPLIAVNRNDSTCAAQYSVANLRMLWISNASSMCEFDMPVVRCREFRKPRPEISNRYDYG